MHLMLYRFFITLCNIYLSYKSASPPNPRAKAEERQKYEADKSTSDFMSSILWWYRPVAMMMIYAPLLIEEYLILGSLSPSIALPSIDIYSSKDYVAQHPSLSNSSLIIRITPTFILGTVMVLTGSLIRLLCYRHLGKQFTFELSTRKDDRLITNGPYSIVRHPSYVGSILLINGVQICEFGPGSWWAESGLWSTVYGKAYAGFIIANCTISLCLLVSRIPKEDKLLKKEFAEQWIEWEKRTPYRLFPGIY